ncbi:NHL repeat-containing protein 2 [Helicoverpa armigera]|uniref:NHL repeat-containing protein 2 n=1 Tax=Helicoverpa armigera TaxID=29058 RepID=UPI003083D512
MEAASLDFVAQACMDLTDAISGVTSEFERDSHISYHIKKVWSTVTPIEDFKKNLEWVNVSEPISLAQHCSDKIVILDFWTYCCINCYHVLPDLAHIEKLHSVEKGVVVIGVHCAKFTNEKDSSNVLSAVQRYGIHHPVVNDADSCMWDALGIKCWPTLLILGPGNKPLFVLTGEGHRDELVWYVGNAVRHFGSRISNAPIAIAPAKHLKPKTEELLYFPSKLALNPYYRGRADEPFLAISDTGHHRIVLTDCAGVVLRIVGGLEPGFKDGKLNEAQFNSPQGVCWLSSNVLAVCDTNNHAVRAIHLDEGTVEILAGTGEQSPHGDPGINYILYVSIILNEAQFNSPQGVCWLSSNVLAVCDTNNHAVRAIHLDEGTVEILAGTGEQSPHGDPGINYILYVSIILNEAQFNSPQGVCWLSSNVLAVCDTNNHAVRAIHLDEGTVEILAGTGEQSPHGDPGINYILYVSIILNEAQFNSPQGVCWLSSNVLAVCDTNNHAVRAIHLDEGTVEILAGTGEQSPHGDPGINYILYVSIILNEAQFNSPQGVCWLSSNVLAVCDTNNHAVRAIHLDEGTVEILAGTGEQSPHGDPGGKCLGVQPLASPWDVLLYTTPDMDMSVRPLLPPPPPPPGAQPAADTKELAKGDHKEKDKDSKRRVLLIACAGSHQIWALFLDTTIWWKYKTFTEGTCVCIAGSGAEAARNSAYPHSAAFAQPSGLTLRTGSSPEIFIADSESSSIRRLALTTGQVSTLCGGDRNPLNLFAYGDVDDTGVDAKLQHPLGVAYCESSKTLYVADTYNHKIKKVEVGPQKVTTLNPTMNETTDPAKFNEPSGLSITGDGKYLYIADTNNHCIKILNLTKNVCQDFKVRLMEPKFIEPDNLILYKNDLFVNRKCGNLIIYFNVSLDSDTKNVKFTPGAPQNWLVCVRDENSKDVTQEDFEFISSSHKGSKLPGRVEMKLKQRTDKFLYRLYLSFHTALCDASVCFSHSFTIRSTILVRDSVKKVESYKITCKVNPVNRPDTKQQQKDDQKS